VSFAPSRARISKLERVRSSEITKDYQRRILAQRVPVAASIELTMRCNLHCAHCYCPLGNRVRELDTEEVKAVFDGLTSMGTFFHCAHRSTCSNCPGVALWETRSSDSHVDFACHLSELRAKRYAGDAVETRGGRLPPPG
jgi:hypothetical protein